jgi:hypothetical protein
VREFVCPKCETRRAHEWAKAVYCGRCCVYMTLERDTDVEPCIVCEVRHETTLDESRCRVQVNVMRTMHNERLAPEFNVCALGTWMSDGGSARH